MPDPTLKVGDVAIDLVKRGKLQVVGKAADSVAEYTDREDFDLAGYKSHPLLNVSDDEPVYTCVYLPDEPTVSLSGTYDFPESRLARVPVEAANQDLQRLQTEIVVNVLATMYDEAFQRDANYEDGGVTTSFEDALDQCWPPGLPEDVRSQAKELAEARRFGEDRTYEDAEFEEVDGDE